MIVLKNKDEIKKIKESNEIVVKILNDIKTLIKPGLRTIEIDDFAYREALKYKAYPAFKGYRGYQHSVCVSINDEVVHGIPKADKRIKEGDIISIDFGVLYKGYYGDAAFTISVGNITEEAKTLIKITKEALYNAISKAKAGFFLGDLSYAIQSVASNAGFSPVRDFVGHGIGRKLHEEPQVPNFGEPGRGVRLQNGMILAIEPMINAGDYKVKVLEDGWTAVTADGSLSAHFEHTIAITDTGPEILSEGAF